MCEIASTRCEFDAHGRFFYRHDSRGKLHSEEGFPAIEYVDNKTRLWYFRGSLHRDINEGPAYISPDEIRYYVCGKLHNDPEKNLPAVIKKKDSRTIIREFWTEGEFQKTDEIPGVVESFAKFVGDSANDKYDLSKYISEPTKSGKCCC